MSGQADWLGRVLLLEDDADLRRALAKALRQWGGVVTEVGSIAEAASALSTRPDIVLTDVRLPDGDAGVLVAQLAEVRPVPIVVAMSGLASPSEAFRLARLGVAGYLPKPFGLPELRSTLEDALQNPPDLGPLLTATVGRTGLGDVQRVVRKVMFAQALARAEGNRSGAARLLRVTRQAVQQAARDLEAEEKALATGPADPVPPTSD